LRDHEAGPHRSGRSHRTRDPGRCRIRIDHLALRSGTATMTDLAKTSFDSGIAALSDAIDKGGASPVDIVTASLARAEAANPDFNAFITISRDRALHFARAAEERARAGARLSPLDGIPIAVKDMVDVRGLTTTNGSGPGWHRRPERSAPVVEALERLGAVVIGKTLPHELGVGIDNNNPHYGPTRNP